MKSCSVSNFRRVPGFFGLISCIFALPVAAFAQSGTPVVSHIQPKKAVTLTATAAIPALLLSDIHFEPFADPGKVQQLAAAPVEGWKAILAAPASADLQQRLATLQQSCHTRGADTSFPLLESSLQAMRVKAGDVRFVTVSGDLIAHSFPCKFNAVVPNAPQGAYKAFVEKTLSFVLQELNGAFPGVPVYLALGNNDSDCGDYQLDAHSDFLAHMGADFTKDFPVSERKAAQDSFAAGGYYSVSLPAPIEHARLLVLDDLFMGKTYRTCSNKDDATGANEQLAWLQQQLELARANKEKIWVMGHIPPGINLHSTVTKLIDVCAGQKPVMFLASDKMADIIAAYGDVVQLAIFAHTHMDEMHLLRSEPATSSPGVAMKMVSSISPVDGNNPSFTVAYVEPSSAVMGNYQVYAASNQTGIATNWSEEYDYMRSYHQAAYDGAAVSKVIAGFQADLAGKTAESQEFMRDFFVGNLSPVIKLFWPQYACTLSNRTAAGYKACSCAAPAGQ